MLTFKQFLSIIEEDAALDKMVVDIQAAINQVDAQITQRTQQLIMTKQQLQRRLVPLLKKKQQEDQKAANKGTNQDNQVQTGTNTTTPGSTGQSTPGSVATTSMTR